MFCVNMTHFSGSSASPSASSPLKPCKAEDFEGTPALKGDRDGGHGMEADLTSPNHGFGNSWCAKNENLERFPTMKLIASKRINLDPPSTCRFG